MPEIIIGVILGGFITWLIITNKKRVLPLRPLQWIWILISSAFSVFVVELIFSFLREGSPQAALVMGAIFGFISVLAWVLIFRFILKSSKAESNEHA